MKRFLAIAMTVFFAASCSKEDDDVVTGGTQNQETQSVNFQMNQWAYAQMRHHYLWREDLPDSASLDYELEFSDFFKLLKSPRDRFSYYQQNNNYTGSVISQLPEEPGFEYQAFQDAAGETYYYVLYATSRSLRLAGLDHGKWVKPTPDGRYAVGTFSHDGRFVEENVLPAPATRALGDESNSIYTYTVLELAGRKVAYLAYTSFEDKAPIREVFEYFRAQGATDVVIDLRYNHGGLVDTSIFLATILLPSDCMGKDAEYLKYNDIVTEELFRSEGVRHKTYTFYSHPKIPEYSLAVPTVYFLVSGSTASASEGTINILRPYTQVVTIGTRTVGKGTGMYTISDKTKRYALVPITFRYYNADWEGVPDEGMEPDYIVPDEQTGGAWALGNMREPMLNKALSLIVGQEALDEAIAEDDAHAMRHSCNETPEALGLRRMGQPSCLENMFNDHETSL